MRKSIIIVGIISIILGLTKVDAKVITYQNDFGLKLNNVEYQNILNIHGNEFLENMTIEDYLKYKEFYSCDNLVIEKKVVNEKPNTIMPLSDEYETSYKKLTISKVSNSSNSNLIVINLKWKKMPTVKSYDVIGARLYNTSFQSSISTYALINGSRVNPSKTKELENGVGSSIKLKDNSSSISVQQSFTVSTGGTVYASYQHAVQNITLNQSQDFSISSSGLGKVFRFANNSLFDQMDGVDISV